MTGFSADERQLLADTDEVHVEFRPGRQVPIWIMVDGDEVYVRSVRGPRGVWYQTLAAGQPVKLHAGDRSWPIRGELVTDQAELRRVSDAVTAKYNGRWPGPTAAMLRDDVLPTTLRVAPAN